MHIYFYARGINHQVEVWKILMQSQFWVWTRFNLKTGKNEDKLIQGALRPSVLGLWEYVIPEEALPDLLAAMELDKTTWENSILKKCGIAFLRKAIGAKKINKKIWEKAAKLPKAIKVTNSKRGLNSLKIDGVIIHIVGIKTDRKYKWEEIGYEQEML